MFARKGFPATTLDEIAEEAGLTKGAVYSNFESKEDLVRAVDRAFQERAFGIGTTVREGTIEEQATEAGELFGAFMSQQRAAFLLFMEFTIHAVRNPEFHADLTANHREGRAAVAKMIEEHATASGRTLRVPAEEQALIYNAITNGTPLERLIDPDGVPEELYGRVLAILAKALEEPAQPEA